MLYYAGVDIKMAQYLLGHSTISMTMEIYTHLDPNKTKGTAEKLNALIAGSQEVVRKQE
jgi:integrase